MGKKKGLVPPKKDKKLFADKDIPEIDPPGKIKICRPSITLRNGKQLIAAHYGLKAFCFYIDA